MRLRSSTKAALRALAAWVLPLAILLVSTGSARADGTLRTVLVIDASSSMLSTDPHELRKVAAELFVDLARDGDEIAVTGFDGGARESTGGFIAIQSPSDRERLKAAVRGVGKDGAWTDFTAGLDEAKRILATAKKEAGDQTFVVFLTDGRCDPDPKGPLGSEARAAKSGTEAFCKQRVLDQVVPSLAGTRLYAVGLSRSAPRDFLDEIARRTGGVSLATDHAEDLPHLFMEVYARLLGSTLVDGPAAESIAIPIDEGALSLDVVVVGPRSLTAQLFRPDGAEVARSNAKPEIEYYVDAGDYRFFKVSLPPTGTFQLKTSGAGKGSRYAALQNLDLRLAFVDPPEVLEIGTTGNFKVRLATPGGRVPNMAFLDRHKVAVAAAYKERCSDPWLSTGTRALPRGPDGTFTFTLGATTQGHLCMVADLVPGPGGVLTRKSKVADVRLVPPLHLAAAPLSFGWIKQEKGGKATIDLSASQIGEAVECELAWGDRTDLAFTPKTLSLDPKGERRFEAEVLVDRDATPGKFGAKLTITPVKPRGYADRAITIDVDLTVIPLTFWERYGTKIEIGAGVLLFLFVLFGVVGPARFKRTLVLHYKDVRDPELPREGTYPLGVKAKAGFYRGAKCLLAATGPVRMGGVVELRPAPGGGVIVRPLGGQKVLELPREDTSGLGMTGDPREVPLVMGCLRCSIGARYEVAGAGLQLRFEARAR